MRLLYDADELVGAWFLSRVPHMIHLSSFRSIGVLDDTNKLAAAVIYHQHVPEAGICGIGFATDTPRVITRGLIRAVLAVPFVQYGCRRVTAITQHDLERSNSGLRRLGFKREGCMRHLYAPRRHGMVYGMLRHEYDALCARLAPKCSKGLTHAAE